MALVDLPSKPTSPTSLKLPPALKSQVDEVARKAGISTHAYMIQALTESVQHAVLREAFAADCAQALQEMDARGKGHELGAVRQHFSQLAAYRAGKGGKPAPLRPTNLPK